MLEMKRKNETVPQYSLTGDLLSYLRCGLQYRYHNGSALPPSRPVQIWFGEFIHGVLEGAFRIWQNADPRPSFPWPCTPTPHRADPPEGRLPHDIGTVGDAVELSLRTQGKNPRSGVARSSAYERADAAVNQLGPHLFPLIASAEERVIGTREIPPPPAGSPVRARLYELHGIIDVLTHVELTGAPGTNVIKQAIREANPALVGNFEVIVDYKGTRRPPSAHPYWEQGDWQVQTYAWLRSRQAESLPVAAGVLLYINELAPAGDDIKDLQREVKTGATDVVPAPGSEDENQLRAWRPTKPVPAFSLPFRMARAIRVAPVNPVSQGHAAQEFDKVVRRIEDCVTSEEAAGRIVHEWESCGDEDTCAACDFRHFCPSPAPRGKHYVVGAPSAP